ncbi:hypothetical protein B0H17DRAFT_1128656 [Mycena rosella]|uniref:Uncharacterized protein n=1 Tax=Mycena rosella TaxID=1033263 RepID=A0AAD7DWN1_MYCRO|nr:hypothetical protein B0H17DRAFT_1128656 [Mycena rosella]
MASVTAAATGSAEPRPRPAVPNLVAKPHETRLYSTSRLDCLYGYKLTPALAHGLAFELPGSLRYHGREVHSDAGVWELWSPNSTQHAYLPGIPIANLNIPATRPELRHWDGHWVRFNFFINPRYDEEGLLSWTPFVRRAGSWGTNEPGWISVVPVFSQWKPNLSGVPQLSAEFVRGLRKFNLQLEHRILELCDEMSIGDEDWEHQSGFAKGSEDVVFDQLDDLLVYEDAVDKFAMIQRALRAKDAWILMVEALRRIPLNLAALQRSISKRAYPEADDRVPVFVSRRYESGEVLRLSQFANTPWVHDFLELTKVRCSLSVEENSFQHIARRQGYAMTMEGPDERGTEYRSEKLDIQMSSSLFLEARQQARTNQVELPTRVPYQQSEDLKYEAPSLTYMSVAPDRAMWIRPPLVQDGRGPRKWEKWAQKGVVGREVYGTPAPHDPFFDKELKVGGEVYKQRAPSDWVYNLRLGERAEIGKMAPVPAPSQLPLRYRPPAREPVP